MTWLQVYLENNKVNGLNDLVKATDCLGEERSGGSFVSALLIATLKKQRNVVSFVEVFK